jgi:CRP-like cAMP-binding protein
MDRDTHLNTTNERYVVNRLIERLPLSERESLLGRCELIELTFEEILFEPDQVINYAYFPLNGFISLVTLLDGRQPLEMALIGNEGMVGLTLMLGVSAAPMRALVQGAGQTLRMKVEDFKQEIIECPAFHQVLNRYLYVMMRQFPQIAACTHFHEIKPRLARWLLMTHDRSSSDSFHLTHEFLAGMLGVRRSGITVAASSLQQGNLIDYRRGEVTILNRRGLEKASCTCYQTLINDYEKQFGSKSEDSYAPKKDETPFVLAK